MYVQGAGFSTSAASGSPSGTSLTGVTANHGLYAILFFNNTTAPGITSITDSAGTTWAVSGSPIALTADGEAIVCAVATGAVAAGTHTLTVNYTGSGNYWVMMVEDTLATLRAAAIGQDVTSPGSGQTLTPGGSVGDSGDLVYLAAVNVQSFVSPVAGTGGFTIPSALTGTNSNIGNWALGYNASAGGTTPSMAPGTGGTGNETGVLAFALEVSSSGAALASTPAVTTTATGTLGSRHIVANLVQESTTSPGTGAFALAGALTGFQAFSAVMNDQDTCLYMAQGVTSGAPSGPWEIGIGTYNASGNTLSRTQVLKSSNANALVNFTAAVNISLTEPAEALWNKGCFNNGPSGSAITIDWSRGPYQMVVLTANCTLTFVNSMMCPHAVLELYQDQVGSRVPTLSGAVYRSGSPPSWSTAANAYDTLDIHNNVVTGKFSVFLKV